MQLAFATLSAALALSELELLRHGTPRSPIMQTLRFGLVLETLLIAVLDFQVRWTSSSVLEVMGTCCVAASVALVCARTSLQAMRSPAKGLSVSSTLRAAALGRREAWCETCQTYTVGPDGKCHN